MKIRFLFYVVGSIALLVILLFVVNFVLNKPNEIRYNKFDKSADATRAYLNTGLFQDKQLVLFFNKDKMDKAPQTWEELKNFVIKKKNTSLNIPVIALGRADNIAYSSQIFIALLKQENAVWPDDLSSDLGNRVLQFYNEFANPDKKVYTWNKDMPDSLEAFAQNKVLMIFALFKDRVKFTNMNYGIARMPVIKGSKINNFDVHKDMPASADAIMSEMIESVADNRATISQAIQKAYQEISDIGL